MKRKHERWDDLFAKIAVAIEEWRKENPEATLTEIEETVGMSLAEVQVGIVEDLAEEGRTANLTALPVEERPLCPQCGTPVIANGKQKRKLITEREQTIELERSKAYCPHCQASFFPSG